MITRRNTLLMVLALLAGLGLLGRPLPAAAQEPAGGSLEERVMREAISTLGWPDTVTSQPLYELDEEDDTMLMLWPPGSALQYLLRTKVSATNGGSADEETIQYARILSLGDAGGKTYLEKMVENGFTASSYQGRPAAIVQTGQKLCGAGGLVGYLSKYIGAMFAEMFGTDPDDNCPYANAGYITWTCGSHTFVARDDTGQGGEEGIAAALYAAAENQGLCDLGDTLVILASTDDVTGATPVSTYVELGQKVNSYYGQNAYGSTSLAYTYLDADGSAGSQDWFTVEGAMADYQGKETAFAIAAVQKAFEASAPREELNLSRVIVVHAGPSQQLTHDDPNPAPLQTVCAWSREYSTHEITVGPPDNQSTVYASSLIVIGETDGLGLWAHEVGHSLYGRHAIYGRYTRVGDRYNYQEPYGKNGDISNWGLMGLGNWWGDPLASDPVHMMAFSKEAAGWLEYEDAVLGESHTLTALESASGSALKIDNPNSANPENYAILEARQSGGAFGAPENGVVLYNVTWDSAHKHHVVNNISPVGGTTAGTGAGDRTYDRPTLRGAGTAGNPTWFKIVPWRLMIRLVSESTASGYSAVVSTERFTPTNLIGATVAPAAVPPPAAPPTVTANIDGPLPDIDLHAWDDQGRHVGLNYGTGQYENQIPGAEASGDLRNDEEWIYVPEGTAVRYAVSAEKTRQFLEANPSYAAEATPQEFDITFARFDGDGNYTVADGGHGVVPPGIEANLSAPTDPSLRYRPAPAFHYDRNWPENTLLLGFVAGILALGGAAWVVALVRR